MDIFSNLKDIPKTLQSGVVSIGNFDGVHRGHQNFIEQMKKNKAHAQPTIIVIFEPQPIEFFLGSKAPKRLTRLPEKIQLIESQDIDALVVLPFDKVLAQTKASDFINQLVPALLPKQVWVGHDFRFGKDRCGDFDLIKQISKEMQFEAYQGGIFLLEERRVSSTIIRSLLEKGQLEESTTLLGRPYFLKGTVVEGDRIGRTLGYPTANIEIEYPTPICGAYVVKVVINNSVHFGMANVGYRPSIGGNSQRIEAHIFEFNEDIYDQQLDLYFMHHLRQEIKFGSLDELKRQLSRDKKNASDWLAKKIER